jgi:hypothetical protein
MTTIKYDKLLPGDVLLHASKGEVSKLIQWASDSDYSHIAMVYEPGQLAEAVSSGVHFDSDLKKRIEGIPEHFRRIDAWRPTAAGNPISPEALAALKASAQQMAGRKFALNQWFELGLICAVRNKVPDKPIWKWLITLVIDTIVRVDPSRLLCSEFLYLSFFNAVTVPPGKLRPVISRPNRPNRPFPKDLDIQKLIKEYLKASGQGEQLIDVAALINAFASLTSKQIEAGWETARDAVQHMVRPDWVAQFAGPHPDLIEPQDFAESPSFYSLGSVVIV